MHGYSYDREQHYNEPKYHKSSLLTSFSLFQFIFCKYPNYLKQCERILLINFLYKGVWAYQY